MTVYRDSQKPNRPIIACRHGDITYVTNSTWSLYLEKIKEGKLEKTLKTIFFDTLHEMLDFIDENCKVIIGKIT